jgi:hypothetical protein
MGGCETCKESGERNGKVRKEARTNEEERTFVSCEAMLQERQARKQLSAVLTWRRDRRLLEADDEKKDKQGRVSYRRRARLGGFATYGHLCSVDRGLFLRKHERSEIPRMSMSTSKERRE